MSALRNIFLLTLSLVLINGSLAIADSSLYHAVTPSGVKVDLAIEATAPEVMKPLPVKLKLTGPDGAPVSGAEIKCALTMPAMAMPNNHPPLKKSAIAGQYEGVFLLTMGGLWHVEFDMTYQSGAQDSVVMPIAGVVDPSGAKGVSEKLEELFQEGDSSKQ